uniref:MADF domain-containing protein n=1 Tax=Heliothis virescens TaxID=7102 RepID=A0A2A4JZM3_HELVI
MEKFIETVRAHPCLWNPQHPDYPEVHARGQAWQSVINEINDDSIPNIKTARTEWRKLRDNHREALKRAKLGQNKLLPAHVTTWKYAKAMQFLEPHMKYRITENIEMDPPVTTLPKNSEHDVSTTNATELAKPETVAYKRRCVDHIAQEKEPDALESFFNCILKSTRDMPQWMQTQVKKKIFAVIIDAEESLSSQSQARGTAPSEEYATHFIIENKIKREYFEDT